MRRTGVSFLAAACGGKLLGNSEAEVSGVVIDSREAAQGAMFVCVVGDINDGHNYAESAYELGARVFLMSDAKRAETMAKKDPEVCVILAEDTSRSFKDMAAAYINQFDIKLKAALTGSVGKTTTRELVTAVLSQKYNTICNRNNYNTHLGLCLTCFLADESTEAAVFEMGMDKPDEIAGYCEWIKPDAALITNIGVTHVQYLGTRSAICDTKLGIIRYFKPGAPLFYIPDGEYLYKEEIVRRTGRSDVDLIPVLGEGGMKLSCEEDLGTDGIAFRLRYHGEELKVKMPLLGMHNAKNAALAAALGLWCGIPSDKIVKAFAGMKAFEGRLKAERVGNILLLDDSYNASPDSMEAGLTALAGVKAKRHIAVLGDMLELGDYTEKEHKRIGRALVSLGIDAVFTTGSFCCFYLDGMKEAGGEAALSRVRVYSDVSALCGDLDGYLDEGDAVIVKGSHVSGIDKAVPHIKEKFGAKNQRGIG